MKYAYTYSKLERDLEKYKSRFTNATIFSIGKSVEGRKLYALRIGRGDGNKILFNGAHHGMEWLTSKLLIQFAFELTEGCFDRVLPGKDYTLYIIPMINPDGVEIASMGKEWQANANGVDLNHNYDAMWHMSKQSEKELGISGPCKSRFSGNFPESEPESHSLANFTRQNNFDIVLAFHSQGEVIYQDFCGFIPEKSYLYSYNFEKVSPYRVETPIAEASHGGYKDWFIKTFKRPGFTIEIGKGKNPLDMEMFPHIYERTLPLMIEALKPL